VVEFYDKCVKHIDKVRESRLNLEHD
jgi:hypothetical protein